MPTPKPVRTSGPTFDPLTLDEAKVQCRQFGNDFDGEIKALIRAAWEKLEYDTGLTLCTSTFVEKFDAWPDEYFELRTRPVQSITSITYLDTSGNSQTWDASNYALDVYQVTPVIRFAYQATFPATRAIAGAITVTEVAGYAAAASVPYIAKQAMLLNIRHWFDNKSSVVVGAISSDVALGYEALIKNLMRSGYP